MRLKFLSCEVLARELYFVAATSPHIIDFHMLRRGLHDTPEILRAEIQKFVDEMSTPAAGVPLPDAICLGYALCGNAVAGVTARNVPLVLPRAHDCITLYLGSRVRYQEEFTAHPGTYYYAMDYLERSDGQGSLIPLGTANDAKRKEVYEEYVQKYGKDNADYLLEVMGGWTAHYNRAAFIELGVADATKIEQRARDEAAAKGWTFEKLAGDLKIIRKLAYGEWDDDFLIIPAGGQITVTYDAGIVGCRLAQAGGTSQ